MFVHCTDRFAIMAATRCGHTNMYNYFDIEPYSEEFSAASLLAWREHHNSIVVLRNPLERLVSATRFAEKIYKEEHRQMIICAHSLPYLNKIFTGCNFRIIDFYELEQYIPRRSDKHQSLRTDSHIDDTTKAEDVYVANESYSLQVLQFELKIYKELMVSCERVSVEEWKKLTM